MLGRVVDSAFTTQTGLREENARLERQVLELAHVSQQFIALSAENQRLRELMGSQARLPHEVLIAEVVGVVPSPQSYQLIIDKGADVGLEIGQAVLDAHGLIGQVVSVAQFTSRVLVITDPDHAVPVQVNRNGVRSIAGGTGANNALLLENVPVNADIVEGDLIETSGLAGRFPRGYPVGRVISVIVESTSAYAQVVVQPAAQLDRTRHVLVIFTGGRRDEETAADDLSTPDFGDDAFITDELSEGDSAEGALIEDRLMEEGSTASSGADDTGAAP